MITRVRCPGCGEKIDVDEDEKHPDEAVEEHTTTDCKKPSDVVCERLGWTPPDQRAERRKNRQRVRDTQRRRKRKPRQGVVAG